jgi:hypothetical protein
MNVIPSLLELETLTQGNFVATLEPRLGVATGSNGRLSRAFFFFSQKK